MINLGTKELESSRLLLRKFKYDDLTELMDSYLNQDEFLYYANKERKNESELKEMLLSIVNSYSSLSYYNWLISKKDDGKIIGAINLKFMDEDTVIVSYAIDVRYTKKGYMSEALTKIKNYCFEELKVRKLVGLCCIENTASKRVLEKCGFILKSSNSTITLKDGIHKAYEYFMEE